MKGKESPDANAEKRQEIDPDTRLPKSTIDSFRRRFRGRTKALDIKPTKPPAFPWSGRRPLPRLIVTNEGLKTVTLPRKVATLDNTPPPDPSSAKRLRSIIKSIEASAREEATPVTVKDKSIEIHPEDDTNVQTIIGRVYSEQISDLDAILAMVDEYSWSSERTKIHERAILNNLFNMGALDLSKPRPEERIVKAVNLQNIQ